MHARTRPEATSTAPHARDLKQQLSQALAELASTQRRCEQLQAQLRDGRQRELRQRHRADHDDLTGLLNRAAFREHVQRALTAGLPAAVLLVDLDGFKQVNDTLGHAAGDDVLRIVAARMSHALRRGDVVSRLGGDEFACLLRSAGDSAHLDMLADKFAATLALPMQVAGGRLSIRASVGVARCHHDGNQVETLLACADAAMYRIKRLRNGSCSGQGHMIVEHHADLDGTADLQAGRP